MPSTCYITAVNVVQPSGERRPHIAKVKLSDGTIETKEQVIGYLGSGWQYYTYAPGVPQARVIAISCPTCTYGDYITTEPDYTYSRSWPTRLPSPSAMGRIRGPT